jgi:imidazole glycerol phosphate synthase glutamine amidotransferase subunit
MIALVDYGAGNLRSIANALDTFGLEYRVAEGPDQLADAAKVIVPGVGHFGAMMASLKASEMDQALLQKVATGVPLLGICLGMQVLFDSSEEAPGVPGLGLLSGSARRLPESVKVPQMGWNEVLTAEGSEHFYFANSYVAPVGDFTIGKTTYGLEFSAWVRNDLVEGFQFHPEKSGAAGLQLLREWCERC